MKRILSLLLALLLVIGAFGPTGIIRAEEEKEMSFSGAEKFDNNNENNNWLITLKVGDELTIDGNVLFDGQTLTRADYYFMGPILAKRNEEGWLVDAFGEGEARDVAEIDFEEFKLLTVGPGIVHIPFNSKFGDEMNEYGLDLWIVVKDVVSIAKAEAVVEDQVYTGKAICPEPVVTYTDENGAVLMLEKDVDYTVSYKNNINAGTAKLILTGNDFYNGKKVVKFKIQKAAQPMTVKGKTVKVKAKTLKSKNVVLKPSKTMTIKKAKGKVTYKKVSGPKKLSINKKTGKITVKKGTPKGTYTIKVKVTAAGSSNYKKGSKTVKVKVKVV